MLDVLGTNTERKCSKLLGSWSRSWSKASTACVDLVDQRALAYTQVDDFLVAFRKASKAHRDALKHLVHTHHLTQQIGTVVYCGRTVSKDGSHMKVNQAKSALGLERMSALIWRDEHWRAHS